MGSNSTSTSVALVKVNEENVVTSAGVLGGLVGLAVGGFWVGTAVFAASAYISRSESDAAKALKGISQAGLEVVNFGAYVNERYEVSDRIGGALSAAVEDAKTKSDTQEVTTTISNVLNGIGEAYTSLDKDVGIKESVGTILTAGGELASQAVGKALEINEQYKISEQLGDKVKEAIDSATSSSSKKA